MILVIAEKPSVASSIASVLGANDRQDGYFKGSNYIVTFVFGHVLTLFDAKDYDPKYETWDVNNLPIIPDFKYKIIDDQGVKKQVKQIEKLIKEPDVNLIINACDADREGSLIFSELYNFIGVNKPVKRLWVSSHTPEDIKKGFDSIRSYEEDVPRIKAGYSRQWADWLFGINFTVATSKLFSKDSTVLNIGRVILPTVYLVYLRDMEIKNFKSKKHFELVGKFQVGSDIVEGTLILGDKTQFDNQNEFDSISKAIKGQTGKVISVENKTVKKGAGKLFNLTDLQGYISSKYEGFSAAKVLKIAQSLYEKKVTTYPRTASRYLDDSQKDIAGRSLDAVKGMFPDINISFKDSNNIFNSAKVDSHPALMPTYITPKDGDLSPDENIVYSEIVKRFCALFAPEAEYLQTEAFIEINGYKFRIKGKVLTSPGWKQIYGTAALKDEDDDLESELKLQLKENMLVTNIGSDSISKETKPPSHYTIQGLLDAMQNCGKSVPVDDIELFSGYQIGSPNGSSRADILSKIEKVGYVQLKGKSYRITKMGIDLIELFPIREMLEPSFTGRLEKQLKDIELGSFSQDDFMTIVKDIVSNGIEEMKGTKGHIGKDILMLGPCPACKKGVVESEKGFGCSGYKETGCKFYIGKSNPLLAKYGVKSVPKTLIKNLLSNSLKSNVKLGNKNVDVSLEKNNDNDFWSLKFNFDKVSVISLGKCPECGKDVVESEKGYGCSGYKEGCKFSLWKDDLILKKYGKKLSVSMVKEFLAKKQCSVKGLVDPKNGAVFDATINFAKNEKGYWGYKIFKV